MKKFLPCYIFILLFFPTGLIAKPTVTFQMFCTNEMQPHIQDWCKKAKGKMKEWYPRFINLMGRKINSQNQIIKVYFVDDGAPGLVTENKIFFNNAWITDHPNVIGLAIHELIHVIQDYQGYGPAWLVDGIADYYRWVIFEGKYPIYFPADIEEEGYKKSYKYTAGFLYWLELIHPGIIKKLDSELHSHTYNDETFEKLTGQPLQQLWSDYYFVRRYENEPIEEPETIGH